MGQPVVHFEIGCRNRAQTAEFFAALFGWKISDDPNAAYIRTGSDEGIGGHINSLGHEPHNYVNIYIQVGDIAAYLKKVESLGGKTIIPKTEIPNDGHFAWFADPEGTTLGLYTPRQ